MRLLIDEDVPESVTRYFRERGHDVHLVREELLPGTPDPAVAAAGDLHGMILVTWNTRDFRKIIQRRPAAGFQRFRKAGLICFKCSENMGVKRLEQVIRHIELEYEVVQDQPDRRLIVEISTHDFRIVR